MTGGESLAALRGEIDRIDEGLHELLMERGAIIDRLIAAKRSAPIASAFRPDREAAMLRVLAERHRGSLPLDAVEGIWRVIISTFTHAQAPFAVHADEALGSEAMRDSARFHFGFTVPYRPLPHPEAVVAAVGASEGDLGLLPLSGLAAEPWWNELEALGAPKVIARLPFLPRPGHPAPLPVLVIARSSPDIVNGGATVVSARFHPAMDPEKVAEVGGAVLASAAGAALIALPPGLSPDRLAALCEEAPVPVGSYPEPFSVRA